MFLFGLVQCVVKLRLNEMDEKWLWILYLRPGLKEMAEIELFSGLRDP